MRISDWSSDVCSSDLRHVEAGVADHHRRPGSSARLGDRGDEHRGMRSEERRAGNERVTTRTSRWSPHPQKQKPPHPPPPPTHPPPPPPTPPPPTPPPPTHPPPPTSPPHPPPPP